MDPVDGDLTVSGPLGRNWNRRLALTVTDYDNDATDEVFLSTSELYDGYFTVYDFFGETAEWTSPKLTIQHVGAAITHADLTSDGHDDLLTITSSGVVYLYDPFNESLVWQSTTLGPGQEVLAQDLDDDGVAEIVAVTANRVYVYSRVPPPLLYAESASYAPAAVGSGPPSIFDALIGDTDGDGALELVLLLAPSNIFDERGTVHRLSSTLELLSSFDFDWRATSIGIEPSPFPRKNLLLPNDNVFTTVAGVDAASGKVVWRSPPLLGRLSRNSLHLVDFGNGPRVTIGTDAGMFITR
jgi:hypothetical protein